LHDTPETVRDEQAFLARHGVGDKPIWITENGYLQSGGAEPLAPGAGAEHTEAQELAQAEYLVKAHIRFQSLGIAKNFSFFFCPYNECGAGRVWGILRWDYAAKVAYAAIANLTAQLSNAEFLGTRHQPGIQAFVYRQKDGTRSLVFWSEGKEPKPFSIKDSAKELTAVDFTGGRSVVRPVNGEFAFSADRYPTYVNGFLELPPGEKKDTLPHGREKREDTLPHGRVSLRKGMDLAVVLRMNLGEGFRIVLNKALVDGTDRGRGVLDVFNLSDEVKTGRVENPGTGYTVLGLPESITLKPMSKVSLEVNFKFESAGYGLTQVRLGGTFNGKEISPIYIPVKRPHAGMDPGLQSRPLPVDDAGRWVKNSSGSMTIFADEKEQAAGFKVTFPPATDQWIYPEFRLNLPAESMCGAVGIGFEVKASKAEGWALVMACMDDVHERGEGCWLPYYPTTEWQTVNILFEEDAPVNFRPENIKMLRIGANPSEREFEFRVRKMRVYFKK